MSESYDEYGNYYTGDEGEGYVDPGQMSVADVPPATLAAILQQNSEVTLANAFAQQQQQQQFQAAQQAQTDMHTKLVEAEKILEKKERGWNAKQTFVDDEGFRVKAIPAELAYQVVQQHHSMLPAESFTDAERLAEDLRAAAEFGKREALAQERSTKRKSDDAAVDRIEAAARHGYADRGWKVAQDVFNK